MASDGGKMYIVYQALASITVGLSGFVASLTMGYTSPALPSMQKDPTFEVTEEDGSWIGAVMPASALIGSLVAGPLLDRLGRRASLILSTYPFMLSWALIASSTTVRGVIIGRMIGGACVGAQAVASSVFMPEIVQLKLRNIMIFFPTILGTLGILISYAVGQFLSWRELAWLGCASCVPQLLFLWPIPETPYFLTRTGKRDSSLRALGKLRETPQEIEKEQRELDESCTVSKKGSSTSMADLLQPPNLWPVAVGSALMLAQQTTGINAVIFYSSTIFEAGGDSLDPNTASTLLGLVNFLGVFVSMYFCATSKRRYTLALSTYALLICLSIISAFFWLQESAPAMSKSLSFVPVVALLAYILGFSLGWGPVPWIFISEGIPSNIRGLAVSVIVAINWGSASLVTKTFQWSISILGIHYTFFIYAVITGISGALIHRTMPETFGLSTAEMDNLYIQASKPKEE
ncbi:facilitated trehalose transporter Tret1-2 homolog [Palaemon carinicauda]|uniref:facilitated trehalose transporter Tret1-2 homolog n=1 Tax=Palaemon carinicauda TaxID=392227 RepID=UPI0035B5C1C3